MKPMNCASSGNISKRYTTLCVVLFIAASGKWTLAQSMDVFGNSINLSPYQSNNENSFWNVSIDGCILNKTLIYAVSLAESMRLSESKEMIEAWPYAFHTPDGSHYADDLGDAKKYLDTQLKKHKPFRIDVGLMQINLFWHKDKFQSPVELLDTAKNLEVGCRILADAINSSPKDLELGIGRYHHWKDEKRSRKYGKRVMRIWRNLHNHSLASN